MTLRMPLAATAVVAIALLLIGAVAARPASAHTLPDAPAAIEAHEGAPERISPDVNDRGQGWIWIGVGIFVVFAIFGMLFAVFGYLESTRRE